MLFSYSINVFSVNFDGWSLAWRGCRDSHRRVLEDRRGRVTLDGVPPEEEFVLVVEVSLGVVVIGFDVVLLLVVGNKGCLEVSGPEPVKIEVGEPVVAEDLGGPVGAEPGGGLPEEELVGEVDRLLGPPLRDLVRLDLDLPGEHEFPDLLPVLAHVRPPP